MDKIIARHLTADLYGCKASRLSDEESLPVKVSSLFEEHGFHVMASTLQDIDEDHAALLIGRAAETVEEGVDHVAPFAGVLQLGVHTPGGFLPVGGGKGKGGQGICHGLRLVMQTAATCSEALYFR